MYHNKDGCIEYNNEFLDPKVINTSPYVIDKSNLKLSEIKDKLKLVKIMKLVKHKDFIGLNNEQQIRIK